MTSVECDMKVEIGDRVLKPDACKDRLSWVRIETRMEALAIMPNTKATIIR